MKFAVATIAYQEEEYIGACILNWENVADKHLVLISTAPWNGSTCHPDRTTSIANKLGVEVVLGEWKTEEEQRDWGLARLYDYDYVLIVDTDELYTKEDQDKIKDALNNPIHEEYTPNPEEYRHVPAFRCSNIVTYWKTHEYIYSPPDGHKPIIAVDPKQIHCFEHRQFKYPHSEHAFLDYAPKIPGVTCHHFSMAKSDEKVREKIRSFSHADSVHRDWYDNVWSKWEHGSDMKIRSHGKEPSMAIHKPAPAELVDLIEKGRKV